MSEIRLPDNIDTAQLDENYRVAATEYSRAHKRARLLDMTDKNRLWEAIGAQFPTYQILPETNHVSYIKNNIVAAIYTVGKSARLLPTSATDKDIIENLNIALEHIWTQLRVPRYQMLAGERAALLNLGVTQVGWDNSITSGSGDNFYKGRCVLKNINPLKYMRDPYAEDLESAGYCMTWGMFHKSIIMRNPNYATRFKEFLRDNPNGSGNTTNLTPSPNTDKITPDGYSLKNYYKVITHWVRVAGKIHEIHTIDNKFVLYVKEDIKPNMFPFSELYCNLPSDEVIGCSEPNKIFANSLAYNLMTSIILTSEYRNQRPPKFINAQSGLNVASFTQHGNEADRTFIVNGDASKAVHYHQFPQPSNATVGVMAVLDRDVKQITGIDERYTGRDTGSILTTGGINSMLDQVSMVDAPKIENYEEYSKRLSQLIISNYITHSSIKRKYFVQNKRDPKRWDTVTVDFPKIDNDTVFEYELAISSELPKNKSVIQENANKLMQMQLQYNTANIDVDLITPEEWLMFQDIPFKEFMQERMGIQKTTNWTEIVSQAVNQYGSLVQQGLPAQDAILATADTLAAQTTPYGKGVQDVVDNVANGGMLQG